MNLLWICYCVILWWCNVAVFFFIWISMAMVSMYVACGYGVINVNLLAVSLFLILIWWWCWAWRAYGEKAERMKATKRMMMVGLVKRKIMCPEHLYVLKILLNKSVLFYFIYLNLFCVIQFFFFILYQIN